MNDQEIQKTKSSVLRDLLRHSIRLTAIVWRERKGTVLLLALVFIVVSGTTFLQAGSRGLLINELVAATRGNAASTRIAFFIALMIAASVVPALLSAIQSYLSKLFSFFLEEKFNVLLLEKRGAIDVAVHEDPSKNDLFNRVRESGQWHLRNFVDRQFFLIQNLTEVMIASTIIFVADWRLFFIILVGVIPELFVEAYYGRQVWGIHNSRAEIRRSFWDLHEHFYHLSSLIELKIFQNIRHFLVMIKELFQTFQQEEKRAERKRLWLQLCSLALTQIVIAYALVVLVQQVIAGHLLIGTFTFFLASIGGLRQSLSGFFSNLGRQYHDGLFIGDVFSLLDLKEVVKKPKSGIRLDQSKTPEIRFEDVSFSYPGTGRVTLKNFSLVISPGEKVALIGINGVGKTTFVKLLCRFYDPDKGKILIDGHDLRDVDLESWYALLSVLFQDYAKYHFIVKDAIAVGRTGNKFSLERVKDAAKASEADVFIEEWERGYEQKLGKEFTGGVEPSLGQWQKLALARTFYRNPAILILDEPTSSIDAEAEAHIFERVETLPQNRTVILISHRFSTVRHASKIAVIEHGTVKELGTHDTLLKLQGTYARLFNLQAKGYR